jgi:hypothetical protein
MGSHLNKDLPKFDPKRIVFLGRLYCEYLDMFGLNESDLENKKILDCPGGFSSFTCEGCEKGMDCYAMDMMYGKSAEELDALARRDIEIGFKDAMQAKDLVSSSEKLELIQVRKKNSDRALGLFLQDYRKHGKERYIFGALPSNLPFKNNSFDLLLSSNFLFAYVDYLGFDFHITSITEMLRIVKSELRIYPIAEMDGNRYRYLDKIITIIEDSGHSISFGDSRNNFVQQWNQYLVIRKRL